MNSIQGFVIGDKSQTNFVTPWPQMNVFIFRKKDIFSSTLTSATSATDVIRDLAKTDHPATSYIY